MGPHRKVGSLESTDRPASMHQRNHHRTDDDSFGKKLMHSDGACVMLSSPSKSSKQKTSTSKRSPSSVIDLEASFGSGLISTNMHRPDGSVSLSNDERSVLQGMADVINDSLAVSELRSSHNESFAIEHDDRGDSFPNTVSVSYSNLSFPSDVTEQTYTSQRVQSSCVCPPRFISPRSEQDSTPLPPRRSTSGENGKRLSIPCQILCRPSNSTDSLPIKPSRQTSERGFSSIYHDSNNSFLTQQSTDSSPVKPTRQKSRLKLVGETDDRLKSCMRHDSGAPSKPQRKQSQRHLLLTVDDMLDGCSRHSRAIDETIPEE